MEDIRPTGRDHPGSASTITVDVSSTTTYTDPGVSSPRFSSLAVADGVNIVGTETMPGTINATEVNIRPTVQVHGTVASIDTMSFTITAQPSFALGHAVWMTFSAPAPITIDVSTMTTYTDPGVSSPGFSSLAVGDGVNIARTETTIGDNRCHANPYPRGTTSGSSANAGAGQRR